MFTKLRKYCKSQRPRTRQNVRYRPWKFLSSIISNKYGVIIILFVYHYSNKLADGRMCVSGEGSERVASY